MRLRLVLILSVSSLFSSSIGDGAPAPLQDKDKIQGKWKGIGGEENGRQFTEEESVMEEEVFIFRGDQVTFKKHGKTVGTGTFVLDPSKEPKAIDITLDAEKGEKAHAIYSLKDDRLTICVYGKFKPNRSDQRPKVFTTKKEVEGHGRLLFILKREKP